MASVAVEKIDALALSVGVAPLVEVLKLLAVRVDELHADVRARDEAARGALAAQQQQIDALFSRSAQAEEAARAAEAAITPDQVVNLLLLDIIDEAVEIGERAVARRERADLFARADASDGRLRALQAEAAALAESQAEASRLSEGKFDAVRADLAQLATALEAAKSESGGGLDELQRAVAAAAERLDAHDASIDEARAKSAELVGALRDDLERSAHDLGARLERVEEMTGSFGDVNAELEAKVLREATRLIDAEAELRTKSVEQSAAEAREEMEKLASVLGDFRDQTTAERQTLSQSIAESADSLGARFASQLESVQSAVQDQIVSELMEELSEPKLRPRLEEMGVELSGQSAALHAELALVSEANRRELGALQAELAHATSLHDSELRSLADRLAALTDSIATQAGPTAELNELRGLVATKAEIDAVNKLIEQLNALQAATDALASAKARSGSGPLQVGNVIQIGRDGQPRLAPMQALEGAAQPAEPAEVVVPRPLPSIPAPSPPAPRPLTAPAQAAAAVLTPEASAGSQDGEGGEQAEGGGYGAAEGEQPSALAQQNAPADGVLAQAPAPPAARVDAGVHARAPTVREAATQPQQLARSDSAVQQSPRGSSRPRSAEAVEHSQLSPASPQGHDVGRAAHTGVSWAEGETHQRPRTPLRMQPAPEEPQEEPLLVVDADGQPTTWNPTTVVHNTTTVQGVPMSGDTARDLALLKATIEEVRSAMKVKVDALALHRLRLQIAAHVENIQKDLLDKIQAAEGRSAPAAPPPRRVAADGSPARSTQQTHSSAAGASAGSNVMMDSAQARNLSAALQGHAQMQEMIIEQLAAHENELENLKELMGTFEGRGGLLARLHAQMAALKRTVMDKADKDDVSAALLRVNLRPPAARARACALAFAAVHARAAAQRRSDPALPPGLRYAASDFGRPLPHACHTASCLRCHAHPGPRTRPRTRPPRPSRR